jgi:hypothetical protein
LPADWLALRTASSRIDSTFPKALSLSQPRVLSLELWWGARVKDVLIQEPSDA